MSTAIKGLMAHQARKTEPRSKPPSCRYALDGSVRRSVVRVAAVAKLSKMRA
jgi:TolB-like protein